MSRGCICQNPLNIKGMCGICSQSIPDEYGMIPIPSPPGSFIIAQIDRAGVETPNGTYYHYADVCVILNRFEKSIKQQLNDDWREVMGV